MNSITCILDACTIINLIHIDEDEFLFKELKKINFYISEKVFSEVRSNVLKKLDKTTFPNEQEKQETIKNIQSKVSNLRSAIITDQKIKSDIDDNFFNTIKGHINYTKENGEFFSTALAFYLTRWHETKLFFHTDDLPAKEHFDPFFKYHQIGFIEDSMDLIILLYRLSDNFSEFLLVKLLTSLYYEYAIDHKLLLNDLHILKSNIPKELIRDPFLRENLDTLIYKLDNLEHQGIGEIKKRLKGKSKYNFISDKLDKYSSVFELEGDQNNLLKKINNFRQELIKQKVYKIF